MLTYNNQVLESGEGVECPDVPRFADVERLNYPAERRTLEAGHFLPEIRSVGSSRPNNATTGDT